jgi:hypothetical protein
VRVDGAWAEGEAYERQEGRMKLNEKDADRRLAVTTDTGGFLITEAESYIPRGYSRRKWDYSRVFISAPEAAKLVEFIAKNGPMGGQQQGKAE